MLIAYLLLVRPPWRPYARRSLLLLLLLSLLSSSYSCKRETLTKTYSSEKLQGHVTQCVRDSVTAVYG